MPFQPLTIRPGVVRDVTNYAAEGGYWTTEKVRFRSGSPEKMGGWTQYSSDTYLGTATHLFNWISLAGDNYLGIGTSDKWYIDSGGTYYDITPLRTAAAVINNNPFAMVSGSPIVTVTDTAHGALAGDYVTYSGATAAGGLTIVGEYKITTYVDADTYKITAASNATGTASGGGAAVLAAYQIHVGLAVVVAGTGWGAGGWGAGGWGSPSTITTVASQLRTWSQAAFGEDLLGCDLNGQIYYWDKTGGLSARAILLKDLGGAAGTPTVVNSVLVTEDRHVIALGCNPESSSTLDPLLIRWADTESLIDWNITATNTAGNNRLASGNMIVTARNMKQETIIWTDAAVYSMQFVGVPYTFGFTPVGTNISIAGAYSVAIANNTAYWMGFEKFYLYNGHVQMLYCPILTYIFHDYNRAQAGQTIAGTIERFNEVIWFYCSSTADSPDRYVIFNYNENIWYFGTLSRSAWLDAPLRSGPVAANSDFKLYLHEDGLDDGTVSPAVGINAYIETADMDIQSGEHFSFVKRIIPDISFGGSTTALPSVTMEVDVRDTPGLAVSQTGIKTIASALLTLDQFTDQVHVRLRGRQLSFRIESTGAGVHWQLGKPRLDIRQDGRR